MTCFNTASGMDCMQCFRASFRCTRRSSFNTASGMDCMQSDTPPANNPSVTLFQYRKRYGLHAIRRDLEYSGEVTAFQYRKRYGLHAIGFSHTLPIQIYGCFNTASGMDCMQFADYAMSGTHYFRFQYRKRYGLHAIENWERLIAQMEFQYRKRYGLHAILKSWRCLSSLRVSIPQAVWIACNGCCRI